MCLLCMEFMDLQWVKPRTFYLLSMVFSAVVFGFGRLFAPTNRPGGTYFVIELTIVAGCLVVARRVAEPESNVFWPMPVPSPRRLYGVSLAGAIVTLFVSFVAQAAPNANVR